MGSLIFDFNPTFKVDLQPYVIVEEPKEDKTLTVRIWDTVFPIFKLIYITFSSLSESLNIVLRHSWISFKHQVLGYYGTLIQFSPPKTLPLAIFKIAFWILNMAQCFLEYAIQGIEKRWRPNGSSAILSPYLGTLHPDHFRTNRRSIDVSHVPENIRVQDLLEMFDHNKENELGYVAIEQAERKHLETFVNNITSRRAFTGTPPEHDTPRLLAFYQQIEDALRFSIHKVKQDLEHAQTEKAKAEKQLNQIEKKYIQAVRQYNQASMKCRNCLETFHRLAVDMAHAGSRCGAAYMAESMDAYFRIAQVGIGAEKTLQETLFEILAEKRKKIAIGQAHRHSGRRVHFYAKYMEALGSALALPGSENIIEHLGTLKDLDKYLIFFFEEYTDECIIEHINEIIKTQTAGTSQILREKITTWIQDQANNWDQERVDVLIQDITAQINKIPKNIDNTESTNLFFESLEILQNLIFECRERLPSFENGWNDFIAELFALPSVIESLEKKFPGLAFKEHQTSEDKRKRLVAVQKRNKLKKALLKESLGEELVKTFEIRIEGTKAEENFLISGLNEIISSTLKRKLWILKTQRKISEMLRDVQIESQVIDPQILNRAYSGQTPLENAIKGYIHQIRRLNFLDQFSLENMGRDGLSPKLMEWLLVSQKILKPQID